MKRSTKRWRLWRNYKRGLCFNTFIFNRGNHSFSAITAKSIQLIRMSNNYRKRDRSPSPTEGNGNKESFCSTSKKLITERVRISNSLDNANYEELPKEFFCPISKKFITDPVTISNSQITYDRVSVEDMYAPEDVLPDLRMRNIMEEWFSQYDVDPPFKFISNQDELVAVAKSVAQQLNVELLREFRDSIERELLWLMDNGGKMLCVATLLSFQQENLTSTWVCIVLSIVAHSDEILQIPAGIHPEYSLLCPISRICARHLLASMTVNFQRGLINLMHGLVINSSDISAMAGKLRGIIQALVLNIWPVRDCFIEGQCYVKLLSTLERLSKNDEICESMVNVGIIEMLFLLLDFGISTSEELIDDHNKNIAKLALGSNEEEAQFMVIDTVMKIFDRLCSNSEIARERLRYTSEQEYNTLTNAIYVCSLSGERTIVLRGVLVLDHCLGYPLHPFIEPIRRHVVENGGDIEATE